MTEQVPTTSRPTERHPRTIWLAVIGAAAAIGVCGTIYQNTQIETLRRQIAAYQQDNNALRAKLVQSGSELQNAVTSLRQDLQNAKQESNTNLTMAQRAALKHADLLALKQKEQSALLNQELGKVKESTTQAAIRLENISTDVGSVKTDVGSVRADVDTAKTNIDVANSELKRMRGDLGEMSGLVATNSKEIQTLRDLGDRNIYEFTLSKSAGPQKVGNIQVLLRRTDAKRNRYTVDVLADDKRMEKKDKGTNEPVQFYTSGARQPYELVVNQVKKDQVIGYLATPKVSVSRNR